MRTRFAALAATLLLVACGGHHGAPLPPAPDPVVTPADPVSRREGLAYDTCPWGP